MVLVFGGYTLGLMRTTCVYVDVIETKVEGPRRETQMKVDSSPGISAGSVETRYFTWHIRAHMATPMRPAFGPSSAATICTCSTGMTCTRSDTVRLIGSSNRLPACATPPPMTTLRG